MGVEFGERYGRAVGASDLRLNLDRPSRPDLLLAMAWADERLGSELHRAKVVNDAREIARLQHRWLGEIVGLAKRRRWTVRRPAALGKGHTEECDVLMPMTYLKAITRESLDHWLFGVCVKCTGRRYRTLFEVMEERGMRPPLGTLGDTLSDDLCPQCHGTGRAALTIEPRDLLEFALNAVALLQERYEAAGQKAMRRLAGAMR